MRQDENAYKLLGILQDHAPNGIAQEQCSKLFRDASLEPNTDVELCMVSALYDGLVSGNWPWSGK